MKMKKKLNVDVIRFLVAICVITVHTFPLAGLNETLDYVFTRILFRLCVPFFLLITGYFVVDETLKDRKKLLAQTKKLVIMYLISIMIYVPVLVYNGYFEEFSFWLFLKELLLDGVYYHLWFFPATITGLWLVHFALQKIDFKPVFVVSILLFVIGLLGDSYYGFFTRFAWFKSVYDVILSVFAYTRNGIFYAPFFLLSGYLIKKRQNEKTKRSFFIGLGFVFLMEIEGLLLHELAVTRHTSMYLSLMPASYFLFDALMSTKPEANVFFRNVSTWVYIAHPFFIVFVHFACGILHLDALAQNNFINFVLVTACSCVFAVVMAFFMKKIREKKEPLKK